MNVGLGILYFILKQSINCPFQLSAPVKQLFYIDVSLLSYVLCCSYVLKCPNTEPDEFQTASVVDGLRHERAFHETG